MKVEMDNPYIREMFLQQLINRILLADIAKKYGFSVTDQELAENIASLKYFHDSDGKFNQNVYYTVLRQNNLTPSEFETNMREELLLNNFKEFLKSLINPSHEDLWWYYRKKNEKLNFYVTRVEPEKFESTINITEKEIKDYYDAHKDEFKGNTRKTIDYLLFQFSKYADMISVPDEEITEYYKKNRKNFAVGSGSEKRLKSLAEVREEIKNKLRSEKAKKMAREEAEKAREALSSGESMEEIARRFGVEKMTTGMVDEEGIKKIPITGKTLSELFNSLDEGKISELNETDNGFLIARVTATTPPAPLTLEEAKSEIIKKLKKERSKTYVKSEAEKLQKAIRTVGNPVKFLEGKGYRVEETGDITIGTSFIKGIGFAPGFFSSGENLDSNNRFPEKPYEFLGNYYIYWLKDKKVADRKTFEESMDKIRDEFVEEEVNKKFQELIDREKKTAKIKINKEIFTNQNKKENTKGVPLNDLF